MWDPRRRKRRSRRARASRERRREVANATNVDRERPNEAQSFVLIHVHAHLRARIRRVDRILDEPMLRARARSRRLTQPSPVSRARVSLVVHARSTSPCARRTSISRRDPSLRPVSASSVVVIVARAPDPVDGAHFARIRRRPRARRSSRRAIVADAKCRTRRRNGLASSISEGARAFPPTHRARRASNHPARACDPSRSAIHGHPTNETRETDDDARIASRERSNDARDGLRDRRARVGRTLDASTRRRRR